MSTIFASKFVQTIKTFSEEELKSFGHWLRSPWCNTNKNVPKLFEKLKKYYPAFDNPKLTKEKLFKQVLPNGKFSDRRINNLLSEGYLVAEQFLIFSNLSKNRNLQKDLLTQELQNRHLEDWFFRDVQKEIDRLDTKPIKDWEDYLDLFRLHRRVYHHPNQNPRRQSGGQTIIKMGQQLDFVYLLEKAAIINEKIFRKRILKHENHDIEKELKIWSIASEAIEHPAIKFYSMRFAYQEATMLEQYFELRTIFLEKYDELNNKEQKIHLMSLVNDAALLIRKKQLDVTEALPIHKLGIQSGIFIDGIKLHYNFYTTIVSISNYKGDFDYTEKFIADYTQKLDRQFQLDGLKWAKAHTAYYQKNYDACIDILLKHNFKEIYFKLIARLLTIQVYFDLYLQDDSYHFYLLNYLDSFEKWLNREQFRSASLKKGYLRFVQISRALAKHYAEIDFQANKVESLLNNEHNIQALNWIKNQIKKVIMLKK